MTLFRALGFFFSEACLGLLRSWRVSVLASLAIGVSLFMSGLFLLVSGNLDEIMDQWRDETRIVVYLQSSPSAEIQDGIRQRIDRAAWVEGVVEVSGEEARNRFTRMFPSLDRVLEGWEEEPLPVSFEIRYRDEAVGTEPFRWWIEELESSPGVAMVDDDRDWLRQLEKVVTLLRGGGLLLAAAMMMAAILTIASVIRLTVYLYRDEIATLRLVGATEFFIRGPFYVEGLLEGLMGGLMAVTGLWIFHRSIDLSSSSDVLGVVLLANFLPLSEVILLIIAGALAGLIGAIVSLRRETLDEAA